MALATRLDRTIDAMSFATPDSKFSAFSSVTNAMARTGHIDVSEFPAAVLRDTDDIGEGLGLLADWINR